MSAQTRSVRRARISENDFLDEQDVVAVEEPLEIRLCGIPLTVLLRTPGNDEELAVGFCMTEGLIGSAQDVDEVKPCDNAPAQAAGNIVDVLVRAGILPDFRRHQAPRYANSACGVCGIATLENLTRAVAPLTDAHSIPFRTLLQLPQKLRHQQPGFAATGGMHAAGLLFDDGALHCVREDVGRHNATDKTLGAWLLERPEDRPRALVVSSRAGFEIVEKAHHAGVPVVLCVGAPTSLAVNAAERAGVTLCAFASARGCNIYSHGGRIQR